MLVHTQTEYNKKAISVLPLHALFDKNQDLEPGPSFNTNQGH